MERKGGQMSGIDKEDPVHSHHSESLPSRPTRFLRPQRRSRHNTQRKERKSVVPEIWYQSTHRLADAGQAN
jgi:hypothetical protein